MGVPDEMDYETRLFVLIQLIPCPNVLHLLTTNNLILLPRQTG